MAEVEDVTEEYYPPKPAQLTNSSTTSTSSAPVAPKPSPTTSSFASTTSSSSSSSSSPSSSSYNGDSATETTQPTEEADTNFEIDEVNEKLRFVRELNGKGNHTRAVPITFRALSLLVQRYGEMDIRTAQAYLLYGASVLGVAIQSSTELGGAGGAGDDEGQDDDWGEEEPLPVVAPSTLMKDEDDSKSLNADQGDGTDGSSSNATEENNDNGDDIILAMDNLDVARAILERHIEGLKNGTVSLEDKDDGIAHILTLEESERKLAESYELLGEAALEAEKWEQVCRPIQCIPVFHSNN